MASRSTLRQSKLNRNESGLVPGWRAVTQGREFPEQTQAKGGQHCAGLGDGLDDDAQSAWSG